LSNRNDLDRGALERRVQFAAACLALSALDHGRDFQQIFRGAEAPGSRLGRLRDTGCTRLVNSTAMIAEV